MGTLKQNQNWIYPIGISILLICNISCEQKKIQPVSIEPIDHQYLFSAEIEEKWAESDQPWRFQAAGTDYSYIGNYQKVSDNFYKDIPDREPLDDSSFAAFQANYSEVDARKYIIQRAANEQIVIINEAHHKPKHRVFTESLLQELYDLGFRYFGAETFAIDDITPAMERKYPIYETGTYTNEPQFGNLVRTALKMGYTIFHYENMGNGGKQREIDQANNIKKVLDKYPDAKMLIHCGYAHATEGEMDGSWEKAMAGRLYEFTGINPLTVNQSMYDNKLEFEDLHPIQKRITITQPTVFLDSNDLSFKGEVDDKGFDIIVFHEQNEYENERPDFLIKNNKKWVEIDLQSLEMKPPFFVFAFYSDENISEAIPTDLIEVVEPKLSAHLALEKGSYKVIIQNVEKQSLSFDIDVE